MAKGRESGNGLKHWADVAVAHQRSLHSFDALVQPILDRYGLSRLGAANVLFLLAIGKGKRRISDIVKSERYINSNASYALSILSEAELVVRYLDLDDKRMRLVEATSRGRKLIDEINAVSEGDAADIEAALGAALKLAEFVDASRDAAAALSGAAPSRPKPRGRARAPRGEGDLFSALPEREGS